MSTLPIESADAVGSALLENLRPAAERLWRWGQQLADVYSRNGRLFTCGNGGSVMEAQHLTAELTGRFAHHRRPLSVFALPADSSASTAVIGNYGSGEMYARHLHTHADRGDVLVVLSGSGASANVMAAAAAAREIGLTTWALTGPPPNPLAAVCDDAITVQADTETAVHDMHVVLIYSLCTALEAALGR